MDTIHFFTQVQLVVTLFLVALLWSFHNRFRKQAFFRLWAWAWTSFAMFLGLLVLSWHLPPQFAFSRDLMLLAAAEVGYLQIPLLVCGAWSLQTQQICPERRLRLGVGLALAAGAVSFAFSWTTSASILNGISIRSAPRTVALAVALLYCASVFVRQWRSERSWAAVVTAVCCVAYAVNQGLYGAAFINHLASGPRATTFADLAILVQPWWLFLDITYTCGICLGLVLLLVENHQQVEHALLQSKIRERETAANNAVLEAEIQKRIQVEQALRENEAKFRSLAEAVACAIWIYRGDRFLYVNRACKTITGYSEDELFSMSVWDLVHPQHLRWVRERAEARKRGENVPSRYEFKILTPNGEERWLDFTAVLTQFEGQPAILGTAFDVTTAKKNEEALRERTAYLETLVSSSPLAIVLTDAHHCVRLCNPAFRRMFHYTEEEVLGEELDALVGLSDSGDTEQVTGQVRRGESVQLTTRKRRKDGSIVDVELHAVPLLVGGSQVGCFGIYEDITKRKKAEETVRKARARLLRAEELERARIARELHDEVSQEVALLSLQLDELRQDCSELELPICDRLETVSGAAKKVGDDIRLISHHLHPSVLDLIGLVPTLSRFCKEFTEHTGIKVEFTHANLPNDLSSETKLCLYRLTQATLHNVQKHSRSSEARVEIAVESDRIRLSVSDFGKGFDPASIERSEGLGLVSMRERVQILGGQFSVCSKPGQGTSIVASLPLALTAAEALPKAS